tara:strand:- start:3658 stop:4212 length:555 start_codon:yes stop_codon:yes gene_type:complete
MSSNKKNFNYKEKKPNLAKDVFVADGAKLIGDVTIGKKSGIWYNCVLRADVNYIKIGEKTNIQDGTIVHVSSIGFSATGGNGYPTIIGDNVTIGHNATVHACNIKSNSLIGMGSVILDNAVIGEMSIVAAGCVITPGTQVKDFELWAGNPGKFIRRIKEREKELIINTPETYYNLGKEFLKKKF